MSTDPTAMAHEVLDLAHEDETVTVCSIPDRKAAALARAVIDLTATVKRVEALADRLEASASELEADGADDYAEAARIDARSIRTALNGDDK